MFAKVIKSMSVNDYETIIVGLGAAGVTAASTLAREGRRVLALEAQDYIGGRVRTVPFGDGVVELGAEWIHGTVSSNVFDVAVKHNIPVVAQDLDLVVYRSDGVKPDHNYQEVFNELVEYIFVVSMEPSEKPEPLGVFVTRKLMEYIKTEKQELLERKELIDEVLDYSEKLMNNYNASNSWNDIDSHGKYEHLDGHQHMSWHKFGYKKYFDILLNADMGFPTLDIKLNKEVTQMEWSKNPADRIIVSCKDGAIYTALNVIVTVSIGVLKESHTKLFKPNLPEEKIQAIEKISMGVMDKIELSFNEIWWPQDGVFFGFVWSEEDRKRVPKEDLWTTQVFSASRPMGAKNVLTLWTSGEVAKMVETLPLNTVKEKCKKLLQRFLNANKPIPEPTGIERSTWSTNPFTRGSYSFDSIQAAQYHTLRTDLAKPIEDSNGKPRILFAGEACHDTRYSTVHGASDTGYREALKVLPHGSKL